MRICRGSRCLPNTAASTVTSLKHPVHRTNKHSANTATSSEPAAQDKAISIRQHNATQSSFHTHTQRHNKCGTSTTISNFVKTKKKKIRLPCLRAVKPNPAKQKSTFPPCEGRLITLHLMKHAIKTRATHKHACFLVHQHYAKSPSQHPETH